MAALVSNDAASCADREAKPPLRVIRAQQLCHT
jgi:hypothetical protein